MCVRAAGGGRGNGSRGGSGTTMTMDSAAAVRRGVRRMKGGGEAAGFSGSRLGVEELVGLGTGIRELLGRGLRLLPRISWLRVHDALDCSTCDPTLSEWRPKLALGARVGESADLASAARDLVSGQLDATTGGNLVTRSTI
ncbi:hypothetical protein Scep_015023 [Stephania cephalantha]|uniref:Uncharacterized protein n=1 Tax=Stephania cephalantha TaxID=152367 RepID=A0AAP0J251_9MAGN